MTTIRIRQFVVISFFICTTFSLFGQSSVANAYTKIKEIKQELYQSTQGNCKLAIDSTSKLWKKLESTAEKNDDTIDNIKLVLSGIDTITKALNKYPLECPIKERLLSYRDTLIASYKKMAVSDTIIKSIISELDNEVLYLKKERDNLLADKSALSNWIRTLYWIGGGVIAVLLTLTIILIVKGTKKTKVIPAIPNEGAKQSGGVQHKGYSENSNKVSPEPIPPSTEPKPNVDDVVVPDKELQKIKVEETQENRVKATFYMSIPKGENVFSNENRSRVYINGRTVYLFSLLSDTQAQFEFCTDATAVAIDKPQTHITPACDPQNARDINAKSITTTEKGIANLDTDTNVWIVEKKAKIEYVI